MAGKYLLDQGAAGTGHAKHKNRNWRGVAHSLEAFEQAAVEYRGDTVEKFANSQLIILNLPAFQIIAFAQMVKGSCVISTVIEGFSQCEMDMQCVFCGQIIPLGQFFKCCQVGITMTESLDFRAIVMSFCIGGPDRDRPSKVRQCVIDSPLHGEFNTKIEVGVRMVRIKGDSTFVMRQSIIDPALRYERVTQVVMGIHMVRVKDEGTFAMRDGGIDSALGLEGVTQIAVGIGKVGFEGDSSFVMCDGVNDSALLLEGVTQIVVSVSKVGFEGEGTFEMRHRVNDSALNGEHSAQIVVGVGKVRFESEGTFEMRDGGIDPALRGERSAQIGVRVDIVRF